MNCLRCGHAREPERRKWCGLCAVIVNGEQGRARLRARYQQYRATGGVPCQRCGLPRGPRRKKWCAICAEIKRREQADAALKRYRAQHPELVRLWNYQAYLRRKAKALRAA